MLARMGFTGLLICAALQGCGESSGQPKVADPSLYEPRIVSEPGGESRDAKTAGETKKPAASASARTLRPTVVSGVALAPTELYGGKLRLLVPQVFARLSAEEIGELFKGSARPDVVFRSPDGEMFIVVALLATPLLPDKVEASFPAAKKALATTYPDCPKRIEALRVVEGATWMHFDLDGEKRAMIAMTSLDRRQLRVEASFRAKPAQKWVDVVQKMWDTAIVAE